jgi:ADP-ribosyl-[dinitrogen reductase] hydrolase
LLGLAAGDAVGATVEFCPRGSFPAVTDMVGGGKFSLEAGQWTDDTSMALCLATSILERNGFDAGDQMTRYWRWVEEGYLSSNGRCFDVGFTVMSALHAFRRTGNPLAGSTAENAAGNGCIMRLAPVPMYWSRSLDDVERFAGESSRTTHGAEECIDACRLLGRMIARALAGQSKEAILLGDAATFLGRGKIKAIARGSYRDKRDTQIRTTGYVVDTLEAALWAFHRTETFADAILAVVNLGDDADTTAAVCGQVAGAFYGERGIPSQWLNRLSLREEISLLADGLARGARPSGG